MDCHTLIAVTGQFGHSSRPAITYDDVQLKTPKLRRDLPSPFVQQVQSGCCQTSPTELRKNKVECLDDASIMRIGMCGTDGPRKPSFYLNYEPNRLPILFGHKPFRIQARASSSANSRGMNVQSGMSLTLAAVITCASASSMGLNLKPSP
jgi:hypothetical protein